MEKNTLSALIGRNVRYWRLKRGLTQDQLAERLEVTKQYIGHIEGGSKIFSVPLLRRTAEILEVSADALLFDPAEVSALDRNILRMLAGFGESEKEAMEGIVRLCRHLCSDGSPSLKQEEEP